MLGTGERAQTGIVVSAGTLQAMSSVALGTTLAVLMGRRATPFAVSMVFTVNFLAMMVFAPVWGAVADATGRHRDVLVATGGLAAVSLLPLLFVGGVWVPIGSRGLFAVFAAGFVPVLLAIISERSEQGERGRSLGLYNGVRSGGIAVAQVLAGAMLAWLAPAGMFGVLVALLGAAVVLAAFVEPPASATRSRPTRAEVAAGVRERLFPAPENREHLRRNGLPWLYAGTTLRSTAFIGVYSLMAAYLTAQLGVAETLMGLILALNPASRSVFMYVAGSASDVVGRKPLIVAGMVAVGLFALIAAGSALPAVAGVRLFVIGAAFVVVAAGLSMAGASEVAFIGDVADEENASALMGLRVTFQTVGATAGSVLLGAVATLTSYEAAFATSSLFAFVGAVVVAARVVEPDTGAAGTVDPTPAPED